jgi:hypothetical protein
VVYRAELRKTVFKRLIVEVDVLSTQSTRAPEVVKGMRESIGKRIEIQVQRTLLFRSKRLQGISERRFKSFV